jgi:hypothetical protein
VYAKIHIRKYTCGETPDIQQACLKASNIGAAGEDSKATVHLTLPFSSTEMKRTQSIYPGGIMFRRIYFLPTLFVIIIVLALSTVTVGARPSPVAPRSAPNGSNPSVPINLLAGSSIIVDHTAVDQYDDIPQEYIDQVKKMWLNVPGESHSSGYRKGLQFLEDLDSRYQVNITETGMPEAYTDQYLRISRASWGDVSHTTGWRYGYGEEDWYTSAAAIQQTKDHLSYANANGFEIAAMGFGWCWDTTWHNVPDGTTDPVYQVRWAGSSVGGPNGDMRWGLDAGDVALTGNNITMDTYLSATQGYIDYAQANGYPTKVFFTTGPVDGYSGESGYQRQLNTITSAITSVPPAIGSCLIMPTF